MMPVPGYLKDILIPNNNVIDEKPLVGNLCCSCKNTDFELLYPGQTHEFQGKKIPCDVEIDGITFFLIKVKCVKCGSEYVLLDADFHGWNGFLCHNEKKALLPRPPLTQWKCLFCGDIPHKATIKISSQGKRFFKEETDGEYDEDKWPDAFEWFSMSIICSKCAFETP